MFPIFLSDRGKLMYGTGNHGAKEGIRNSNLSPFDTATPAIPCLLKQEHGMRTRPFWGLRCIKKYIVAFAASVFIYFY